MEGAHSQLRAWFTDRLRGDNADRCANLDQLAGCHIAPVTLGAHAAMVLAGQRRTHQHTALAHQAEVLQRLRIGCLLGDTVQVAQDGIDALCRFVADELARLR